MPLARQDRDGWQMSALERIARFTDGLDAVQ